MISCASSSEWIKFFPESILACRLFTIRELLRTYVFFSYERLPRGKMPDGLLTVMPDLVIEVRSPSDKWTRMFIKVGEYLAAGVRAVVILDPITTSASVYRADEFQQIFHNGDPLTVPDVLPGFSVEISRLFP